jgi:predicted Zn-dependent protease
MMTRWCRSSLRTLIASAIFSVSVVSAFEGAWSVRQLAASDGEFATVGDARGKVLRRVPTSQMRQLYAVMRALEGVAEIEVEFVVVDGEFPNAFAGELQGGRAVVGINFAMLELIALDMHQAAALLGHELAHLKLAHGEKAQANSASSSALGAFGGVVLGSIGVPAGAALSSLGVGAMQRDYSRENEREADYLGAVWSTEAGFEAEGAVRLHQSIGRVTGAQQSSFFSSHPSSPERIAALKALAARLSRSQR